MMPPLWNMAIIASRYIWFGFALSVENEKPIFVLKYSRLEYLSRSKTHRKNKEDLTAVPKIFFLHEKAIFPATYADLYTPEKMPENLRHAHERNDEVLERIYIGRRFKNDTERLEKLFDLYTKMTSQ